MKAVKVCEYRKKKKSEISCIVMVISRNGCYNTINPKNGIRRGFMRKKIGFWGFILSCSLLIILNLFTSNEWKAYSRKKKIVFSIEFVIIISTIPFLLLKGNEILDGIEMFQGWLFIAKLLYLICIVMSVSVIVKKVNEKLFVNE